MSFLFYLFPTLVSVHGGSIVSEGVRNKRHVKVLKWEAVIIISIQGKMLWCEELWGTTPKCHSYLTCTACRHIFLFHIFLSFLGELQEGCLCWNAIGCKLFHIKELGLNTSAPFSHSVTNTYILDGAGEKSTVCNDSWQRQREKKLKQLQS